MITNFYPYDRTLHCRLFSCNSLHESDLDSIIEECVRVSGTTECTRSLHYFPKQGLSSVSVLSESHLAFHITPEHRYVQADISTCGRKPNPLAIVPFVLIQFCPDQAEVRYEFFGHGCNSKDMEGIFPRSHNELNNEIDNLGISNAYSIEKILGLPESWPIKIEYHIYFSRKD